MAEAIFGEPIKKDKSLRIDRDGFNIYTVTPGTLLRIRGLLRPETDNDEPLDIPAPEGLVVRTRARDEGTIVRGDTPRRDRLWRYVGAVKTPDERIQGGWRAWERDGAGKFTKAVMHPAYNPAKPEKNPTLGLENL